MRMPLVLLLLSLCAFAQAQKIGQALADSEATVVAFIKNDSTRTKLCNNLATYYMDANTDSALKYADLGMALANRLKWRRAIAVFDNAYANIFTTKGQLDSAMGRDRQALDIFIGLKDSFNIASTNNDLGTIENSRSNFAAAARYFLNTLEIGTMLKENFLIGLGSENLGLVYIYQMDYAKAFDYTRKSVAAYTLLPDGESYLPAPLANLGDLFRRLKNYDSASYYYTRALAMARKVGNRLREAQILNSTAENHSDQQDFSGAIENALAAKKIWDATGPDNEDAINNTGILGTYYLKLAKQVPDGKEREQLLQHASANLEEAIKKSRTKSIKTSQSDFQLSLSEADALAGSYKDAYLNYKSYQEIKDSVYSQESKNKIAATMTKLELDKKNAEIALNQATISNQHRQELFLAVGIVFLFLIGGLFYRQSLVRKRTNAKLSALNNELAEANKIKARFFGILSHDLRSPIANLINFLQLQKRRPGLMSEEQIAQREKKIADSAESLLGTMEAMLLWSKGQMEQFKPTITDVPVDRLFDYLEKNFANTPDCTIHFSDHGDLHLQTDEHYLRTILHNLTANAVKALRQTTDGQITWKAWRDNTGVLLSISDNGPGATDEQLRALYDDSAPTGARTGLGLHIIRDLAKAIGCEVTYNRNTGTGAEFILRLAAAN